MNERLFIRQLEALSADDWNSVIEGRGVVIVDDLRLDIGPADAPNTVIVGASGKHADAGRFRRETLGAASELLHNYYLTHPLTRTGFNHQVKDLLRQLGALAFVAPPGRLPPYTLFVDGGEVVAEPLGSPRHKYGVFFEPERPLDPADAEARVGKWLERGEAHERYLEMNVCRYNC